jgi:hypothetical protein
MATLDAFISAIVVSRYLIRISSRFTTHRLSSLPH